MGADAWIFGYGSLIWRPSFEYARRLPAHIHGFVRRFWQASTDHRGTPDAPGRVVTLIESAGARLGGVAYQLPPADVEAIMARLDHRERGGYDRREVAITLDGGQVVEGLLYAGGVENPNYAGEMPAPEIAAIIRSASGPSGTNIEYLVRLARALEDLGERDAHVEELAKLVGESTP